MFVIKKMLWIIAILFCILILFKINIKITPKLAGNINFNSLEISNSINDTHSSGTLGNYLFLMSPVPNDDSDTDWFSNPSFIFITDNEYNILDVIQLEGYFEEMSLLKDTLYVFTPNVADNDYIQNLTTPLQMSSTYNNGEYEKFKESADNLSEIPSPTVGLSPNTITIIDQGQVISLDDPTFELNGHDYFIVDFVQNINSVQTETIEKR